jgi:hypothetical protein
MARWSIDHPGTLVIADRAGNAVDAVEIPLGGDRPAPGLLCNSLWSTYPGPDWEEDRPGKWSRAGR